jgi:nucleoside-diphosphate-sugar epimerase
MSKVLIVGGAGYVGGFMVDLLQPIHEVRVYDNLIYEDSYLKDIDFVRGNILDSKALKPHLDWAETVIWLAAFVGDPACAVNPDLAMDINTKSVENLINNFNGRIIFPSTCSVYGAQIGELDETSAVNPLSIYATSKLMAEKLLVERGNSLIFRLGTLFGISDNYARLRVDLVVNVLTIRAKIEGRMRIFGGDQYRPLLHVKDVANAVLPHIDCQEVGIFNLHSENLTIKEVAEKILSVVPESGIEYTETVFQDSRNYRVSSSKAHNALGFVPKHTVLDGIKEVASLVDSGRITNFANPRFTNVETIRLRESKKHE